MKALVNPQSSIHACTKQNYFDFQFNQTFSDEVVIVQ